ncbi:MAG TPA: DUF4124 domain-containing protein [Steroidobacteraceae bacterium]
MRSIVRRGLVALCLLALGGWAAAATLYKWVDAQGVVHYSDTPHEGAEKIQVSGAQTYHNTPAPAVPGAAAPPPPPSGASAGYVSCAIASPGPDTNLFAPESVEVSVRASPGLHAGDSISVYMDGQPLAPLGSDGTRFQVPSPDRGEHTLTARILGPDGAVMCNAAPVTFSIQRPSVNSPQSPVRPH